METLRGLLVLSLMVGLLQILHLCCIAGKRCYLFIYLFVFAFCQFVNLYLFIFYLSFLSSCRDLFNFIERMAMLTVGKKDQKDYDEDENENDDGIDGDDFYALK